MKTTHRLALAALAAAVVTAGCDGATAPDDTIPAGPGVSYDASYAIGKADNPNAPSCGGIAGFVCPEGMKCLMRADYPDAMGTCVGPQQHDRWTGECAAVKCMQVECPAGMKLKITPNHCCGTCVGHAQPLDEGQCATAADCEGLPHIMCVGAWSCDQGACGYTCDSGPIAVCEVMGLCVEGYVWDAVSCRCEKAPVEVCYALALCVEGYVWDAQSCRCEKDPTQGEACGSKTCPSGQVCCNSSCGICTEPGGLCTQQVCLEITE
jgi:hypothetical protein